MISMPLTVSIDDTRTIESPNSDEKFTVYQITVRGGLNHTSHTIDRRYREFEALNTRLSTNISVPHLPRKVLLHRRSAKLIEQRRQLLEIYLNELLRRCQQQSIMPDELARFIQIPPYDNENHLSRKDHQQQLEEQFMNNDQDEDEMKYVLEHAPCISIGDYCPWNNDNREILADSVLSVTESARHRRQYAGNGYAQQYGSDYGLYGPGGQGWVTNNNNNNMNNRYPNPQGFGGNGNFNWNQGNRRPEWYYNTSNTIQSSIFCFLSTIIYILVI
ncbi:unnamed protein product [Adineta steineri]|uniref:PX domain-containing protein n=1 Tax=Adineta steineri TaxID=433720 RepID=A0A814E024_9BILA|nr:unnamed protein product [Adineta steineri]CAF3820502.1 unnamed protein product [Adineta steineri]